MDYIEDKEVKEKRTRNGRMDRSKARKCPKCTGRMYLSGPNRLYACIICLYEEHL